MKLSVSEAYRTILTEYPDILSVDQVAKLLKIEPHTVYKMIAQGWFPAVKPGKSYLIPKFGLILYLLNHSKIDMENIEKEIEGYKND